MGITDSLPKTDTNEVFLAPGALQDDVKYDAEDSIIFDQANNEIILYGNAIVTYQSFKLDNADKIVVYLGTNEVRADYIPEWHIGEELSDSIEVTQGDSTVMQKRNPLEKPGIPRVTDGGNTFEAKSMRYNYKTEKGIIYQAVTKQQNLFVHGGRTKIIKRDTTETIYASNTLITTCNAEHPHFGIRSTKQKVVPGKEVIIGPSNIEIAGVPTPLWLPFGFFPITNTAKSGLIIPTGYEYSPQNGFGIADIGYYTPLGEYADLKILTEVYFRGRWGVSGFSNYRKKYKYSGNANVSYLSQRFQQGEVETEAQSMRIAWTHSMDRAAHPYTNFSANVNFTTNQFDRLNSTDAVNTTNNNASSNISFRRTFPNSPFSLNGNANINQNLNARTIKMTLPSLNARMRVIYPFKRKRVVGGERWYEGISLNYNSSFRNEISATDSTIFEAETWNTALMGAEHNLSSNVAIKVLKYLNVSPNVTYSEQWHNAKRRIRFEEDFRTDTTFDAEGAISRIDTSWGNVVTDTLYGFDRTSAVRFGVGVNTKIFGTMIRKKGWLRGLRHVMTPSVSLNYQPSNFDNDRLFGSYEEEIGPDTSRRVDYTVFSVTPFSGPSRSTGNLNLNYGINNVFEAKFAQKKDTTLRKVTLLNTLNFSGNIDLNSDSLQFSPLRWNASTTLIKGVTNLNLSGTYDYYVRTEDGVRIQKFYVEETGRPLRFENFSATLNTNLTFGKLFDFITGKVKEKGKERRSFNRGNDREDEERLFDNFRINHNLTYRLGTIPGSNDIEGDLASNNLSFSGSLQLTNKWRLGVGNFGYNFTQRRLSYPDFMLTRDLHCWEFTFGWQPTRGTYSFNIYVKDSPLEFIRLPYLRRNVDTL